MICFGMQPCEYRSECFILDFVNKLINLIGPDIQVLKRSRPGGSNYHLCHLVGGELGVVEVEMSEASEAVRDEERREGGEVGSPKIKVSQTVSV